MIGKRSNRDIAIILLYWFHYSQLDYRYSFGIFVFSNEDETYVSVGEIEETPIGYSNQIYWCLDIKVKVQVTQWIRGWRRHFEEPNSGFEGCP